MPSDLHQRLEELINTTESGGRLPSEPRLAKMLGVSRATLREAMRIFETQGRLRRRQGVGTFVVHPSQKIKSGLEVLESIETLAEQIGLSVSLGDLSIEKRVVDADIAEKLHLAIGTRAVQVSRVIMAGDQPVAFLVDIVPDTILSDDDINRDFTGSVLDLLLGRDYPALGTSRCEIDSVAASPEIARALHIQRGDALLYFKALLFTREGEPIDYSFSYFLPGYFKFHVIRRVGTYR